MIINIKELNFKKGNGLMPVVVQDYDSKDVLTLAYVNEEALKKTIESEYAHYYRRSQSKVMKKGETSGNVQRVLDILVDCDHDALIFLVKQTGMACHLGKETCFHNRLAESERLKTSKEQNSDNREDELKSIREEIKKVTTEIIKLCGVRFSLAREIGEIKLREGLPFEDLRVEEELRRMVLEKCSLYGVNSQFGIKLLDLLLEESKRLQRNLMK